MKLNLGREADSQVPNDMFEAVRQDERLDNGCDNVLWSEKDCADRSGGYSE